MSWSNEFTSGYNWAVINTEAYDQPNPSSSHKIRTTFCTLLEAANQETEEASKLRALILGAWFSECE